ncbi:hypothetical protein [Marinobacter sp. NFXS9]|uniref:hypothetical protein n=1 Tax=Marinobacter sp. NFXS9 TaxID=2818433 RepID=UPI0032E05281
MRITADMLCDLECAIARDAIASVVVTPDHFYIQVSWEAGRFVRREKWGRTEYGISQKARDQAARDWAQLISLFVDPEGYNSTVIRENERPLFDGSHGWIGQPPQR